MTISSSDRRSGPFVGNASTTVFPFDYKVFEAADLVVTLAVTATLAESTLVLNSDYSVVLNADQDNNPGGYITYPVAGSPLPSTHSITLTTDIAQTQELDLTTGGGFFPQAIENALDRNVVMMQQTRERLSRTLVVPVSSNASTDLPVAAPGNALVWGPTGNLINAALSTGTTLVDLAAGSGLALIGYTNPAGDIVTAESAMDLSFYPGNATAVAASAMKVYRQIEDSTFPIEGIGSIWTGKTEAFAGISKEFVAADGQAGSPSSGLFVFANNNASPADVVSGMFVAMARQSNDAVFGLNVIAASASGITTPKLVGLEIDIEPAAGVTPGSGSTGIYINVFNEACSGAAIQIGGISGGTFANGIGILTGIASNGSGLFSNSSTLAALVNTGDSTYTAAAVLLSNTHRVRFSGTAAVHGYIYNDSSDNLRIVNGDSAIVFREKTDTASILSITNGGVVGLASTGTINWDAAQTGTAVGAAGGASALPATPTGYLSIQVAGAAKRVPYYD